MQNLFSPTDALVYKCYGQSPCMIVGDSQSTGIEYILEQSVLGRGYKLCLRPDNEVRFSPDGSYTIDSLKDKSYIYLFGRLVLTIPLSTTQKVEIFYLLDVNVPESSEKRGLYTSPLYIEYIISEFFSDRHDNELDNMVCIKDINKYDLINKAVYFKVPEVIKVNDKCIFARDIQPSILIGIYVEFLHSVGELRFFESVSESGSQISNFINTRIFNYRKASLRQGLNAVFLPFGLYELSLSDNTSESNVILTEKGEEQPRAQLVFRENVLLNEIPKCMNCRIGAASSGSNIKEELDRLWEKDIFLLESDSYAGSSADQKTDAGKEQIDIGLCTLNGDNRSLYIYSKYSDYIQLMITNPEDLCKLRIKEVIKDTDKLPALVYKINLSTDKLCRSKPKSSRGKLDWMKYLKPKSNSSINDILNESKAKIEPNNNKHRLEIVPFKIAYDGVRQVNHMKSLQAVKNMLKISEELMDKQPPTTTLNTDEICKFALDNSEILEPIFDYRIDDSRDRDLSAPYYYSMYGNEAIGELTDFYHIIIINNAVYAVADLLTEDIQMILQILKQPYDSVSDVRDVFIKQEYVPSTDRVKIQSISMSNMQLHKPICVTRIMFDESATLASYLNDTLGFFEYEISADEKNRLLSVSDSCIGDLTVMDLKKLLFMRQCSEIFCSLYTLLYIKICKLSPAKLIQIGDIVNNEYFRDIRSDVNSFDLYETRFDFMLNHEFDLYQNNRIQVLTTGINIYTRPLYINPAYLWVDAEIIANDGDMCLLKDLDKAMGINFSAINENNAYLKRECELSNGVFGLETRNDDNLCYFEGTKEDVIGIIQKLQDWFGEMNNVFVHTEDCFGLYTEIMKMIKDYVANTENEFCTDESDLMQRGILDGQPEDLYIEPNIFETAVRRRGDE